VCAFPLYLNSINKKLNLNLFCIIDTLQEMSIAFLPLFGVDKSGRTKIWEASVSLNEDNASATATICYGLLNGKKQTNQRIYTAGKNIGKSNETTPYQQAVYETQSKWTDKKDKEGYTTEEPTTATNSKLLSSAAVKEPRTKSESAEASPTPTPLQPKILPMLAHTFEPTKQKNRIQFPCYVQPKLDGVRCISYLSQDKSHIIMQSRVGSHFESLGHLTTELLGPFLEIPELGRSEIALDGELYTDSMPFEQLVGLVKKKKLTPEDREKLKEISYHVYDIVDIRSDATFHNRYQRLREICLYIDKPCLKLVHTSLANNIEEFRAFFSTSVENGFEGAMLRNIEGRYLCNYRSHDLQKYKEFFESEYEICGYKEAEGRDRGTVIWVCRLPNEPAATFNVRPRGTLEMRRKWLEDGEKYIGKQLTVIYQELSEQGVPRFPVGKGIREGY
jgi:ATP-dependent DNA ligase